MVNGLLEGNTVLYSKGVDHALEFHPAPLAPVLFQVRIICLLERPPTVFHDVPDEPHLITATEVLGVIVSAPFETVGLAVQQGLR